MVRLSLMISATGGGGLGVKFRGTFALACYA